MAETSESTVLPPPPPTKGHLPAIWFFFWGEFAERCSYYGMRIILFPYMTEGLMMGDKDAGSIFSAFKMACYLLPLLGGFLADRFFGRYWTIVGFSVPYVLGHFVLGIETLPCMYIALILLACGSGVIKPNISSLLGQTYDQKRPRQPKLRGEAMLLFYMAVNVGSLISQLAIPELRHSYGFSIAFQFPAWLMMGALVIFAAGKPHYAVETLERTELTPQERVERRKVLRKLLGVFAMLVFYWVAYEHHDTIWFLFIRDYVDLNVTWRDKPLTSEQLQPINAAFVILFVPTFSLLFRFADPRQRFFTAATKMILGFVCIAGACGIMALASLFVEPHGAKLSLAWPFAAFVVLTAGEVLVYGTALDLVYSLAPQNMKGFVTACFLLTNTLGNLVNTVFTRLYGGSLRVVESIAPDAEPEWRGLEPVQFFSLTAGMVLVAAVGFYFLSRNLKPDPEVG